MPWTNWHRGEARKKPDRGGSALGRLARAVSALGLLIWVPLAGSLAQGQAAPPAAKAPATQTTPATPSAATTQTVPPTQSQTRPATPGAVASPAIKAPRPANAPGRFVVVLDAAHGGDDTGARISDSVLEKAVVLAMSVRLRSMLNARGITVVTTRESDANTPTLNRAEMANHAQAAACLSLHATASGNGVHLFSSSLAQTTPVRFQPWQTAQSAFIQPSLRLSSELNTALTHAQIAVSLGRTSMQPLDSFACPAVAVEVSPLTPADGGSTQDLSDAAYIGKVVTAIAAAVEQWKTDWRLKDDGRQP